MCRWVVTALSLLAYAGVAAQDLNAIEHVIIFMQENRAFDHYFGSLRGVRGFFDRTAPMLSSSYSSFFQPLSDTDDAVYMLPFRTDANRTNAMCMPAPEMYYPTDIKMFNGGRNDRWNTARDPGYGMAYFTRQDLPYYYALYDEFACGDAYFQSTFTSTNPNRLHLFSGSNGFSVGEQGVVDNTEPRPGFDWLTVAEMMEKLNVSWRVYQSLDNFDDNAFAWFESFQTARPGEPLFDQGMFRYKGDVVDMFEADLQQQRLPQVSWIIAPTKLSEHATNHPCAGEDLTARLLQALWRYPDTYKQSVFILNYDEGGQFYDHLWSPTPPLSPADGYSSVGVGGEINTDVLTDAPAPIGFGWRVPLLIVSPWTRGNIVTSEVLDHTSVIKFLEKRFNFTNQNLSPWRRLVAGDLLSAFDFAHPDFSIPSQLPDTSDYVLEGDVECLQLPDPEIPAVQQFPVQEKGTRISRALPYELQVWDRACAQGSVCITMQNTGKAGLALQLYDLLHLKSAAPQKYALAVGDSFTYAAKVEDGQAYGFALLGPNGFLREFRGTAGKVDGLSCDAVEASLSYDVSSSSVLINLLYSPSDAGAASAVSLSIEDNAYGQFEKSVVALARDQKLQRKVDVSGAGNWYDITVSVEARADCFWRRFMGRMETGKDTISDPAMAEGRDGWIATNPTTHASLPDRVRFLKRKEDPVESARNKDSRMRTPLHSDL